MTVSSTCCATSAARCCADHVAGNSDALARAVTNPATGSRISATSVSSDAPLEYVAEAPGAHHHNTRTAYCADCNSYIDLDLFTLAEYDGYLRKLGGKNRKKNWLRRWMALAVTPTGAHIAYYESPDDVAKYEPLNVLHVSPDSVSQADQDKHPLRFYVQTKSRQFEFDAEDADAFGEWLEAINGLAVDSGDDSD